MNAPGKNLLQFMSALFLLLSAATSMALVFAGTITRLTELYAAGEGLTKLSAAVSLGAAAAPVATEFVAGLFGLALAGRPKAGGFLTVLGLTVLFFAGVPLAVLLLSEGFALKACWQYLTALAFLIPYLIGAGLNRRAADKPPLFFNARESDDF